MKVLLLCCALILLVLGAASVCAWVDMMLLSKFEGDRFFMALFGGVLGIAGAGGISAFVLQMREGS